MEGAEELILAGDIKDSDRRRVLLRENKLQVKLLICLIAPSLYQPNDRFAYQILNPQVSYIRSQSAFYDTATHSCVPQFPRATGNSESGALVRYHGDLITIALFYRIQVIITSSENPFNHAKQVMKSPQLLFNCSLVLLTS